MTVRGLAVLQVLQQRADNVGFAAMVYRRSLKLRFRLTLSWKDFFAVQPIIARYQRSFGLLEYPVKSADRLEHPPAYP